LRLSQYIGDFIPDAQVKGLSGCNLTALIWSKKSAILRAESRLCIMLQKYKVYHNNKVIFITGSLNSLSRKSGRRILKYPGINLKDEWQRFKTDYGVKELCLTGDADEIWKEFKKLFLIIKAAGGFVKNEKREYLFIFRNKKWDLPKGKMDKGEEWEETAIREVKEECGIKKLKITEPIGKSYHIYELKGRDALKQTYWFAMRCGDDKTPVPQREEGIEKAVWIKPAEFKRWKRKMYPSVWDIVKDVE